MPTRVWGIPSSLWVSGFCSSVSLTPLGYGCRRPEHRAVLRYGPTPCRTSPPNRSFLSPPPMSGPGTTAPTWWWSASAWPAPAPPSRRPRPEPTCSPSSGRAPAAGRRPMSGGIIYLGGGTPIQEACGYEDTADDMFAFLVAACGPGADEAKIRAVLRRLGRPLPLAGRPRPAFKAEFFPEPGPGAARPTPASSTAAARTAGPFTDVATAGPRGHHPQHPDAAGGFIMQRLLGRAGADRSPRADRGQGRPAGGGRRRRGRGGRGRRRRAAADDRGPRGRGPDRRRVHLQPGHGRASTRRWRPTASSTSAPTPTTAAASAWASGAGGAAVNLDALECSLPLNPPRKISVGILVNGKGERFINEDTYNGRIGLEILLRQDEEAYLVFDEEGYVVNVVGMRATWVCETTTELAEEIGLPAGRSGGRPSTATTRPPPRGEDPDFHKVPELVRPLVPPLGAIDLRVAQRHLRPVHPRRPGHDARQRGPRSRRHRRPRPLRRRPHHLRHRRPGLRQRHLPRRRQLLRPPGRPGGRLPRVTVASSG